MELSEGDHDSGALGKLLAPDCSGCCDGADGGRGAGEAQDFVEEGFKMWAACMKKRCVDTAMGEDCSGSFVADCLVEGGRVEKMSHYPETNFIGVCIDSEGIYRG